METPQTPTPTPKRNRKKRYALILILLLISISGIGLYIISCEKEETPPETVQHEPKEKPEKDKPRLENVMYEETCETGLPFASAQVRENNGSDWTLSYVKNPVFQGLQSARFEIRKDMQKVGSAQTYRSEVMIIKGDAYPNFPRDVWYSYALLLPAKGMETDTYRDCITQWYEDGTDETTIRVERGKCFIEVCPAEGSKTLIKYDLFGTGQSSTTSGLSALNEIPKDVWNQFVFHFIHSTGSDGLIEIWRNGEKIHTIKGRNMHLKLPKWKLGLYKASMGSSSLYSRVVYFDNVMVGNSSSTVETMTLGAGAGAAPTPPAAPTPTPTPPAAIVPPAETTAPSGGTITFTLINSITDKPIKTIAEGETISLSAIGTQKINIQANAAAGTGSIKFNLTGTESKSRTDGKLPFAALGDDGTGNFYSWIPTLGKYTLKATPYTTTNGSGTAGTATILNFTVIK